MARESTIRKPSHLHRDSIAQSRSVYFRGSIMSSTECLSERSHHEAESKEKMQCVKVDGTDRQKDQPSADDLPPQPAIPTAVVPLYKQRMVLLKMGDDFLRIGRGSKPVISTLKPPLFPPLNKAGDNDTLLAPVNHKKTVLPENFDYPDFTFYADETATITETWYRLAKGFFHMRFAVHRPKENVTNGTGSNGSEKEETETEYLCLLGCGKGQQQCEVQYDKQAFGSWWCLTALGCDRYVAESLHFPGRCLMRGQFGLQASSPLTLKDRARMARGEWDKARSLTIITLPDMAVWHPGVCVF